MIGFMPQLYPDELLYSLFARYSDRSGHLLYRATVEELFENPKENPDILFLNRYKKEVVDVLTKHRTMDDLVRHHTMFNNHGLFVPRERLKQAYASFVGMEGDYRQKLPKSLSGKARVLNYCPMCARQDEKTYSETYWHRLWQIEDIEICPIHHCYLQSTDVSLSAKAFPNLVSAEEGIEKDAEIIMCDNARQIELAEYMYAVFLQEVPLEETVPIGDYLHICLCDTKYMLANGKKRDMIGLYEDFAAYYGSIPAGRTAEIGQLRSLFANQKWKFLTICMMGLFLEISPYDLVHRVKGNRIVRPLEREKRSVGCSNAGAKAKDWKKIDKDTLPLVREKIAEEWVDRERGDRPRRINASVIAKRMGISAKRFDKMPFCRALIEEYRETSPEYWARKVAWALRQMEENGESFCLSNIQKLANIKRKEYEKCLPFLEEQIEEKGVMERLKKL